MDRALYITFMLKLGLIRLGYTGAIYYDANELRIQLHDLALT